MCSARRRIPPRLIDTLGQAPQRFEFLQAVRLLERHFAADRAAGGPGGGVRFRNSLALAFAASQIEALELHLDAPAEDANAAAAGSGRHRLRGACLTPAFIGLLGRHGCLPTHYTERIAERERYQRDRALRPFFDLFSERAVAQFYGAWRKYRLAFEYESDRAGRFLPELLALCGLGTPALRDRLRGAAGIDDESLAHLAGLLRQRPLSAVGLEQALAACLRVPVRVAQFVGRHYALPPQQQSRLGGSAARLGGDAVLGERVWQCDLRLAIHLGPLDADDYRRFLPGGAGAAALRALLGLAAGLQFEFEVRPILCAAAVRACGFGSAGARLGFDAFLLAGGNVADRDDAVFLAAPAG